jgi:DNA-binding response OmpR family regulator
MNQPLKVFAVDDDPLVVEVMRTILETDCELHTFESAEACLARLATGLPDLVFLDVKLPGIDGYVFCQRIKTEFSGTHVPVIFVSSHESIEERIQGYDAGGDDFIVKPFEPEELLRKFKIAEQRIVEKRQQTVQIEEAELLSSLVMANMDETGILLQFMSKLIAMQSADEIAAELLELMRRYGLDGVVQTRVGGEAKTRSAAGSDLPLEVSVIEHVVGQGRIFEFRRRGVHNFERVTLMVNNLPLENPDFCGRLRDHLSVAAQGADSRLKTLQDEDAARRAQKIILLALESVGDTIMEMQESHRVNTAASSKLINELQGTLLDSFYRLGLTDNQEKFLQNMVGDFMARMAALLTRGDETQAMLQRLSTQLGELRAG